MRFRICVPSLDAIIAAIIICWLNAGCFSFFQRIIPTFVMYGLVIIWILLAAYRGQNFVVSIKTIVPLVPSILLFAIGAFVFKNSFSYSYFMFCVYVMIVCLIIEYYRTKEKDLFFVFCVWCIDIGIVMINTFIKLRTNPLIVRIMSTGSTASSKYGIQFVGVAGFSGILSFVIVSYLVFYWLISHNAKRKVLLTIILILLEVVIFQSQIAILIVSNIIGILLILADNSLNKSRTKIFVFVLIVVLSITLWIFLPEILSFIANSSFFPDMIRLKANDIVALINLDIGESGNTFDRMQKYQTSIRSFFAHPLTGSIFYNSSIGGHSTWFDMFALFGLFASAFVIGFIKMLLRCVRMTTNIQRRRAFYIVVSIYFAIGFIDPILFQNVMVSIVLLLAVINNEKNIQPLIKQQAL